MTKAEKRAAAKAAKARAAAAKRRRQAFGGALAGLAAIAVIVGLAYLITRGDDTGGTTSTATDGSSSSASAAPPAEDKFPPLPEGADPALGSKPQAEPGSGELTKLAVAPIIEGKGPAAQAGQQITVNYVGVSYRTGEEFDASWKNSRPFTFRLGTGEVIPGWDQGLVGVKVGSRVQLDLPANLAYGENGEKGGPPGPLRFIVDVLAAR